MSETFVGKIQNQMRISIPLNYKELMKLEEGDMLRITIEKLKDAKEKKV